MTFQVLDGVKTISESAAASEFGFGDKTTYDPEESFC
jgi:hypothetical protein